MPHHVSRRHVLRIAAALVAGAASGCGTILHPERRGQPAGRLDWKIVALDACGLLLFFVPGVVAFAVDFATGTIYLPPGEYAGTERPRAKLAAIPVPREDLSPEGISRVVSAETGRDVRLRTGEYESSPLATLDDFWPEARRLEART